MADSTETSSSATLSKQGSGGPVHSKPKTGSNEDGNVITDFVDAARSAAESLLDNQKDQIADNVSGMAEAFQSGADRLRQSQGDGVVPQYLEQQGSKSKASPAPFGTKAGVSSSPTLKDLRVTGRPCLP